MREAELARGLLPSLFGAPKGAIADYESLPVGIGLPTDAGYVLGCAHGRA